MSNTSVRISLAHWEADLAAVVWPGVLTVYFPRAESAEEVQALAGRIAELERLRGIRPGTVGIVPMIESPTGVSNASNIARSSPRVRGFGVGPNIAMGLGDGDAVEYAASRCELQARALGVDPVDIRQVID